MNIRNKLANSLARVVGPITPTDRNARPVAVDLHLESLLPDQTHQCMLAGFSYSADEGQKVQGTVIQPFQKNDVALHTVVVYFHQTTEPETVGRDEATGLAGDSELAYGIELASRGYVAVGIDHPGFGGYHPRTYELGFQSVTGQMIWNHVVLLSLLKDLGVPSHQSTICIGHSLGGTNAMIFAQYSDLVRLLVCSGSATTFKAFAAHHGGTLLRWSRDDKYMPTIKTLYDNDPMRMPFDIPDLLTAFAPYPLFLSSNSGDDIFPVAGAKLCGEATREAYENIGASSRFRFAISPGPHQFDKSSRQQAYDFVDSMVGQGALER